MDLDPYFKGKILGFLLAGIITIAVIFGGNFKDLFWVGICLSTIISLVIIVFLIKPYLKKKH